MDLAGILSASTGLEQDDSDALEELLDVFNNVEVRNRMLETYYDAEQVTPDIGIGNIPDCVDPGVRCDWARKAVTSVSERVRLDGFVFKGDYVDQGFERVLAKNDLAGEFNRHIASELTHGVMFATVQRIGESASVRMHSADTGAAIWDTAAGCIGAGFVIADMRRTPYRGSWVIPTKVNLHMPGHVTVISRTGPSSWTSEKLPTPLDRPMMEAFTFRATGTKPFGETRITRTVRYLVDEVERTLRYMAVSNAFYATPQRYIMGLTDEQFDSMVGDKWKTLIGSILLSTRDEDGNVPQPGQFSANSPQPYIDAIQCYAKLFSGATGVPLNSLGIVQDNPSSAEAIAASSEDICIAAEDCIESNGESMRNVALMAMAVEGNTTIDRLSEEQRSVMPHFKNPTRPNLASTADAMTKIAGSLEGFSRTREFLSGMGFDESEIESIRTEVDANDNRRALLSLMGEPAGGSTGTAPDHQQDEKVEVSGKMLNGSQTRSLITIMSQYGSGTISEGQAVKLITTSLGISSDEARSILYGIV